MFAIIKSGGRQFKVSVGQRLEVNRLSSAEAGSQVELGDVLLIGGDDHTMIGAPIVENAKVLATVHGPTRGEKLIVFKYKSKKRYRHRRGHRQELTLLTIDDILANGKSLVTGKAPDKERPETVAKTTPRETSTSEVNANAEEKKNRRRRTAKSAEPESSTEE